MSVKDKTVGYFYDEELTNFNYGGGNPMRPHRVRLTHSLVKNYGLNKRLLVHRPQPHNDEELEMFHADDYVTFLKNVTPDNQDEYMTQMRRFNLGPVGEADCPVFDGMFEYCAVYSGGSVGGAALLNEGKADICVNWAGGMHHAKKAEASGFCYVNDIVLAILELLRVHHRVLYVDIDIHHGDGVEEAFYLTDRVMTVSFHKYGDFFPGTGALGDVGAGAGSRYSVNVPLQEGMDDDSYRFVFEPIMQKVMEVYQPGAIVVCGGADSLSGDRLGCFNLSLDGHAHCMDFLAKFGVPMLVLGGGGYTMRNVARCWAYETGRLLGQELPDELPMEALSEYDFYMDTHRLRISVSNMKNANTRDKLEAIRLSVLANLSKLPAAPSAPLAPRPPSNFRVDREVDEDMDVRGGGAAAEDARVVKQGYESEDDEAPRPLRHRDDDMADALPAATGEGTLIKGESLANGGPAAAPAAGLSNPIPAPYPADTAGAAAGAGGVDEQYVMRLSRPLTPGPRASPAPQEAVEEGDARIPRHEPVYGYRPASTDSEPVPPPVPQAMGHAPEAALAARPERLSPKLEPHLAHMAPPVAPQAAPAEHAPVRTDSGTPPRYYDI
ncbi:hypothetical protein WJX81_004308 [Elliptochloris bilobata]|uniref:histone deacetylase n=1 Tax=Elliptochloris bilobata TaxID=381761 RepID=A0AAW1RT77_9CHLO